MRLRLAVRAIILRQDRLLLVNAYPDGESDLWCTPGGGVEPGASLHDNLKREIHEETGLAIDVGQPCLISEFDNPYDGYHQVEVFFRCRIISGKLSDHWQDTDKIVTKRQFFSRAGLDRIRFKPDSLPDIAFSDGVGYDPFEQLVK